MFDWHLDNLIVLNHQTRGVRQLRQDHVVSKDQGDRESKCLARSASSSLVIEPPSRLCSRTIWWVDLYKGWLSRPSNKRFICINRSISPIPDTRYHLVSSVKLLNSYTAACKLHESAIVLCTCTLESLIHSRDPQELTSGDSWYHLQSNVDEHCNLDISIKRKLQITDHLMFGPTDILWTG